MKKVGIYIRISTADKGQDLALQLNPLKEYARARNFTHTIYQDVSSGAKENRPGLKQLMNDARKRKIDTVLVWRFDRFARSSKQLITALEEFKNLGIDFISYQENIDTSAPAGKVMFTLISAMAEFERSLISERVKAGIHNAKRKGIKVGRPQVTTVASQVVHLRKKGLTVRDIAVQLGISKSTVSRCLNSVRDA